MPTESNSTASSNSVDAKLGEFGEKVRAFRVSRGLSQATLAENAHLDRKTISRIENSQYSPSLASVFAIAEALDVDAKELI